MQTRSEDRHVAVLIEFEVDPTNQQALIEGIAGEIEKHFRPCPGFVSASFHASADGRRVFNSDRWRSKDDLRRSFAAARMARARTTIQSVMDRCQARTVKVDVLDVARIIENP